MLNFIYSKEYQLSRHFLFWIFYLLFFTLQSFLYYNDISYFPNLLSRWVLASPIVIAVTYLNIYYLIPEVLLKKHYLKFFALSVLLAGISLFLNRMNIYYIVAPLLYEQSSILNMHRTGLPAIGPILSAISNIYVIVSVAAFIKLFKQWYLDQQEHKELMKEKLEAEINFLKSQIHPHFLFNLLNNLYSLTLKKSDKAPEMILKLSSLLDYMLYQSNSATVLLEKEITLINDFIELEKLRYGDRLKVSFNKEGNFRAIQVSPLLLFPFIENAFKHGASNELGETWVNISLIINDEEFIFSVENKKSLQPPQLKEGIGLKNVKRRLELLYASDFNLNISDEENIFSVKLILPLNKKSK